jgi:hypothetical protein
MENMCCVKTYGVVLSELRGPFPDGMEIPCGECQGFYRFDGERWRYIDPDLRRIERLSSPEASSERAALLDEILGRLER